MKQPTKDTLREQLALAADEIIRLRGELQSMGWRVDLPQPPYNYTRSYVIGLYPQPWWRRVLTPQQHAARQRGWERRYHEQAAQVLDRMQAPREWWHRLWDKCKAACEGDARG